MTFRKSVKATLVSLLIVVLLAFFSPSDDEFILGKVVGVHDGDTITLLTEDKRDIRVRLTQIDAPEKNQPFGMDSKKILSDLIYLKSVWVKNEDVDRYGRTLGTIYLNETDINAEMVRLGAAWVYTRYAYDTGLFDLENEARLAEQGLWALPKKDHIPPWEWRKRRKSIRN